VHNSCCVRLGWIVQTLDTKLFKLVLLLIGALLGATLAPLGSTSIAVAIPLISPEIGADTTLVTQLLVGGYLFICIVGQGPGGKLADTIGTTRTLYLGLIIFLSGTLLGFMVADIVALTISRMAMAVGTAFISPATQSLLRRRMPSRLLTLSFGIYGTTMSAAAALGPWIGGIIVQTNHWSWVFALNIPVAVLSALLIGIAVMNDPVKEDKMRAGSFDLIGLLLLAGFVLSLQSTVLLTDHLLLLAIGLGLTCLVCLIIQENRHSNPILNPVLFQNLSYSCCCATNALNNLVMYSLLFQIPLLLSGIWGLSPLSIGSILLAMTLGMMTAGPIAGVLMNLLGPRYLVILAQLLTASGLLTLYLTITSIEHQYLLPALVACGAGLGLTMPSVQSVALGVTEPSKSGSAAGTLNTFRYIGGAAGISMMTLMLSGAESSVTVHQSVLLAYGVAVAIITLISIYMPRKLIVVH